MIALRDLLLFLSIYLDLGTEHRLFIALALAASLKLLQCSLRNGCRHHGTVRSLLFDSYDNLSVLPVFVIDHFRHATSYLLMNLRGVWWSIEVWIFLGLVLHLELSEERLLKFSLLR